MPCRNCKWWVPLEGMMFPGSGECGAGGVRKYGTNEQLDPDELQVISNDQDHTSVVTGPEFNCSRHETRTCTKCGSVRLKYAHRFWICDECHHTQAIVPSAVEQAPETCEECGGHDFDDDDHVIICRSCGHAQGEPVDKEIDDVTSD